MPSLSYTPGALALTGGEFNPEPVRFSFTAGRLSLAGSTIAAGPSLASSLVNDLAGVLDTLFASEAIVNDRGQPTRRFQEIWRSAISTIKDILTSQGASISELEAIYAGINAAQATATAAVQQAQATEEQRALADSYTNPVGVATAASTGTVTVSAHQRVYVYSDGSETTASVDGGSVTGFAPGDYVTVYYSDPSRAGGAVSYQGTAGAIAQTGSVHIVAQVVIPAVGEADALASGPTAPGYKIDPLIDPRAYDYNP